MTESDSDMTTTPDTPNATPATAEGSGYGTARSTTEEETLAWQNCITSRPAYAEVESRQTPFSRCFIASMMHYLRAVPTCLHPEIASHRDVVVDAMWDDFVCHTETMVAQVENYRNMTADFHCAVMFFKFCELSRTAPFYIDTPKDSTATTLPPEFISTACESTGGDMEDFGHIMGIMRQCNITSPSNTERMAFIAHNGVQCFDIPLPFLSLMVEHMD